MNSFFPNIASYLSIIGGLSSILLTLINYLNSRRKATKTIEITEEEKLNKILATDDIKELGNYFDNSLSNISIYQYSTNEKVFNKVNRYLESVQEYVGITENIKKEIEPKIKKLEPISKSLDEFAPIKKELETGEPWNALARLRRHIEITLRNILESKDITLKRARSAGQLLELLESTSNINKSDAHNLRYAITISNKAIHGYDIQKNQAEEAIKHAEYALSRLS